MGFDIPEPYVWDESFKVFYENLDEEHKQIFQAIFDVTRDPSSGDNLKKLVDVTVNHFTEEEGMMQKANYDGYPTHKQAHDDFVAKIKDLSTPVPAEKQNRMKDWLVQHIKTVDFKYKEKL